MESQMSMSLLRAPILILNLRVRFQMLQQSSNAGLTNSNFKLEHDWMLYSKFQIYVFFMYFDMRLCTMMIEHDQTQNLIDVYVNPMFPAVQEHVNRLRALPAKDLPQSTGNNAIIQELRSISFATNSVIITTCH